MSQVFDKSTVVNIRKLTDQASEITLDIANSNFKSGQYISIHAKIESEEIRRAYSICSAEDEERLKIGVKLVPNGKMSTYLVNQLKEGDELMVSAPEGNFYQEWDPNRKTVHFFIAAGSGITPILSMIKTGLEKEPLSSFVLLYGNKKAASAMFAKELEELEAQYKGQFFLHQTFSQQNLSLKEKLQMRFKMGQQDKSPIKGRINLDQVKSILSDLDIKFTIPYYYICGPGKMIGEMNEAIVKEGGVNKSRILKEHFTNEDQKDIDTSDLAFNEVKLQVTQMNGADIHIVFPKNKTLLEGMEDAGLDAPFSCLNGVCSSCMARVIDGKTEMKSCLALDDDEIAEGKTLTCQTLAMSEQVHISYDE